jgi:hypothetical protein
MGQATRMPVHRSIAAMMLWDLQPMFQRLLDLSSS